MKRLLQFVAGLGLLVGNAWGLESELSVLIDADNDPQTGCEVATPTGFMSGVDGRIDLLIESDDAASGEVTDAVYRACLGGGEGFGPPSALPDNLGPVAIGLDGFNAIEVELASPFGDFPDGGVLRLGALASNEEGAEFSLLTTTPESESPILFSIRAPFVPLPVPVGGPALLLTLVLIMLISVALMLRFRKIALLSVVGLSGMLLAQDVGLRFEWSEPPLAETNAADPASGVDIRALFAQASREDLLNLVFRVDMALAAEPVAIDVQGSPLTLTVNGSSDNLMITNLSEGSTALDIASDFSGTALEGNVSETGNTCASVPPGDNCTLTYTPGNSTVTETDFTIQGSNTAPITAAIAVESGSTLTAISPDSGTASGGTGVTLTGTGLAGATSVSFDGVPATSVNVVNSTTVTAVTPAHATGTVDVEIDTPAGGATLVNAYTYEATAVGQPSGGGTIACLGGGLQNLIAATADNSTGIEWGGLGTAIGAGAQSDTDGGANTVAIVAAIGNNGGTPYAAQLCNDFEVDSQGNTPCQAGNSCYDDWFLPARGQLACLFDNRASIGGFASDLYWSSTEFSGSPATLAWGQSFSDGIQFNADKAVNLRSRCVRGFTP